MTEIGNIRVAGGNNARMHFDAPTLDERQISIMAVCLAIFGLAALYFYPSVSGYESMAPSLAKIAEDGTRVRIWGTVADVAQKSGSGGTTMKLCSGGDGAAGNCISVSIPNNADIDYPVLKGDSISAYGAVSTYSYAKFIRVEKIRHGAPDGAKADGG